MEKAFSGLSVRLIQSLANKLQLSDINEDGRLDIISEGCGYKIISYYENRSSFRHR